jgi:DNA-binding transcriptional ArsR family regulator
MLNRQKQLLLEKQAQIVKALAHPLRLAVVEFLADGERCVCEIAEHVGCGQSNLSKHLAVMTGAGLLSQRKEGLKVYYGARCPCVNKFISCVTDVVRQQAAETKKLAKMLV